MDNVPWSERFREQLVAVDGEMRACLALDVVAALAPFYGMMQYHLGWKDAALRPAEGPVGKLLRPLLCLAACQVTGRWETAVPAAAALELVHNFTLIHDDIEDHSPLRRGQPTVWNLWGIAQAINAGDGLFILARHALLRLRDRGVPPETILEAVAFLDRTILRICEGQYLDLSFERRVDVDEPAYTGMIARKTAALLEAAVYLGALVGGADAAAQAALRSYGEFLGLAFQVQDDLLGVWGVEERTGKPAAADVYGRKLGLPAVYALANTPPADRALLTQVYSGEGPVTPRDVAAVLAVMERVGTRAYVEQVAERYLRQALAALEGAPAGPARTDLADIAASLVGRQR
jgi:geranylgeranyl diphosphate synthase type I